MSYQEGKNKRKVENTLIETPENKKYKTELIEKEQIKRTSSLPHPILLLEGHQSEVLSLKYNKSGSILASGSFDKTINLWNGVDYKNYFTLKGEHKNAITEISFLDDEYLLSCSADKTVILWDVESGEKIKKYQAHSKIINCVSGYQNLFITGSDDSNTKLWDKRTKNVVHTFKCNYPVLSCAIKEEEQIFTSGIDNQIKCWDLKKLENIYSLEGHKDSITGISLSPDGNSILSNSMDQTLRIFDIKPYCQGNRCKKIFNGIQHGIDKNLLRCSWSNDSTKITGGSSDSPYPYVNIWNVQTEKLLYKLPGHKSSINEIHLVVQIKLFL
eukprot:gene1078-10597_t